MTINVIFLTSWFPTFSGVFPKIVFRINLSLTITNTTKKKQPNRSSHFGVYPEQQKAT